MANEESGVKAEEGAQVGSGGGTEGMAVDTLGIKRERESSIDIEPKGHREDGEGGRGKSHGREGEVAEMMEMDTGVEMDGGDEEVHLEKQSTPNVPASLSPQTHVPSPQTPPSSSHFASSSSSSSSSFSSSYPQSEVKEEKSQADARAFLEITTSMRNNEASHLRIRKGWEDAYVLLRGISQAFPMSVETQTRVRAAALLEQAASLHAVLQSLVREEEAAFYIRGSAMTPPPLPTYASPSSSSSSSSSSFDVSAAAAAAAELKTLSGKDLASLFGDVSVTHPGRYISLSC